MTQTKVELLVQPQHSHLDKTSSKVNEKNGVNRLLELSMFPHKLHDEHVKGDPQDYDGYISDLHQPQIGFFQVVELGHGSQVEGHYCTCINIQLNFFET